VLLLCLCCGLFAAADTLDFLLAWEEVQAHHEGIKAEEKAVEESLHQENASRALARPSLRLNATYTHLSDPVQLNILDLEPMASLDDTQLGEILGELLENIGISPEEINHAFTTDFTEPDILFSNLVATWPIYTGGRISSAREIRAAQVAEARFRLDLKKRDLFCTTAKYYFGVVLARQAVELRKAAEKTLGHHLDHALKLEEQGQIARVESLSARVSLDRASVERKKAEDELKIAMLALSNILGRDTPPGLSSPLFINAGLPPVEDFLENTLENFPGLGILSAKGKQAEGMLDVEKGSRLPEFFLFGNLIAYKDDSLTSRMTPDWALGVGMSFEIFDRDGKSEKVLAARSTLSRVSHLEEQVRRDLRVLVEKTYQEALSARNEFDGLQSGLELARENLRLREKAFAEGLSTSLEVVDAQLYLSSVRIRRMAAAYNYVNALARLLSLAGEMDAVTHYQQEGIEVTP